MKKILFVDDEPNVLGGLRRMLRPLQAEWTMQFANGGPQALALLQEEPFDVIVSDMRMPGMTGSQLLEEVRRRCPRIVRIILTGQCDQDSGLRALRVAHQMLCKPCDAESLKATVARTCSLSDSLAEKKLQSMVTQRESIPSAPKLYRRLTDEMGSACPSLEKVAAIVARDIGMVAKILHVVNSSFFGLGREIINPRQAVTLLGLESMRMLVLNVGIFSSPVLPDQSHFSLLRVQSQARSALARAIANAEGADARELEYAGLSALLLDVGQLILLDCMREEYANILSQALASHQPLCDIEQQALGGTHAEVGACLLKLWGLPMTIVDTIAWRHRPSNAPVDSLTLAAAHVADVLTSHGSAGLERVDQAYLERLNLLKRLPAWVKISQSLEIQSVLV